MQIATSWRPLRTALVAFLFVGVLSADSFAQHEPRIEGELIVRLSSDADISDLVNDPVLAEYGFVPIRNLVPMLNIWLMGFDEEGLALQGLPAETVLAQTRSVSAIELAQFNHVVEHRGNIIEPYNVLDAVRSSTPNDPLFPQMWGLNNTGQSGGTPGADVDALAAWELFTGGITSTGEQLVVAIVDSGFDLNHPDLKFWKNEHESSTPNGQDDDNNGYIDDYHGWNAHNNSGNITSSQHGTHVAGTAAARGNNDLGVTGVNWDAAIMPIQGSSGNEAIVVAAYGYALTMRTIYNETNGEMGAFVVATNASFGVDFGNPNNFPIWCGMYDELGQVGIVSTGATMNSNQNVDQVGDVPTACPSNWLLSVTNTTHNDTKAPSAAYGLNTIELGAPGTSILSTNPGGAYGNSSGTSMATPHVTGAIALVVSSMSPGRLAQYRGNPAEVALQIRQAIMDGTDYIGIQTVTGGRLNLHGALIEAMKYDVPDLPEVGGGSSQAAAFDGTGKLEAGPSFRFPRGDELSLSMWAQVSGPGVLAELSGEETLPFRLEVIDQDGDLVLKYTHMSESTRAEMSRVFHQTPLTEGVHHIAVTRGDEIPAVRVFVDGRRVGQPFFYSESPAAHAEDRFYVGNNAAGDSGVSAILDEIRLFRDRLTVQDLQEWMHASMSFDDVPNSLVAYYRFESDTTGFAWDFSNSGNGADITNHATVTSPFPVGSSAAMLNSAAASSGTAGSEGASISATVTSPFSPGTYLAIYASDASDELIEDEDFPEGVQSRVNTVWGGYAQGDVTANLTIDVDSLLDVTGWQLAVLHRTDRTQDWADASANWVQDGTSFTASGETVFGEYAIGLMHPVSSDDPRVTPRAAALASYPNPFQGKATLVLDVPEAGNVVVEVLDLLGRRVLVLHDGMLAADSHQLSLDGSQLAPGMYLVRATGEDFSMVQRVTLVR